MIIIIQFMMDQLRDAPTRQSILFLHLYFWVSSFTDIVAECVTILVKNIDFNVIRNSCHPITSGVLEHKWRASLIVRQHKTKYCYYVLA